MNPLATGFWKSPVYPGRWVHPAPTHRYRSARPGTEAALCELKPPAPEPITGCRLRGNSRHTVLPPQRQFGRFFYGSPGSPVVKPISCSVYIIKTTICCGHSGIHHGKNGRAFLSPLHLPLRNLRWAAWNICSQSSRQPCLHFTRRIPRQTKPNLYPPGPRLGRAFLFSSPGAPLPHPPAPP